MIIWSRHWGVPYYDAIVDAACDAWNAVCNETNLIRSITQREWCDLSVIF